MHEIRVSSPGSRYIPSSRRISAEFVTSLQLVCVDAFFWVMPLTKLATDAFGVLTISLVSLTTILGLLCICLSLYFQLCIRRRQFPQLSFFNGPWITRIILILVTIWWGFGEIVRLTFLKNKVLHSKIWQRNLCKIYILSNLGFAEPSIFLLLSFLLNAALQKRESGTLSRRWNRKTVTYVILFCIPILAMHLAFVIVGPIFNNFMNNGKRTKMDQFFKFMSSTRHGGVCTYPLLSTIVLGAFYTLLICYITFIGARMLSLVINKGLRKRIYVLLLSVIILLPLRVLLLGFSVLPRSGTLTYEAIVFLAFLMLIFCIMTGICMLVYFPVTDSLALRAVGHIEIQGIPYDDYFDGASLIANQNHQEMSRGSETSSKRSSISFHTMTKDESAASEGNINSRFLKYGHINALSSSGSPPFAGRPMVQLSEYRGP